jgi:hypothetical protein
MARLTDDQSEKLAIALAADVRAAASSDRSDGEPQTDENKIGQVRSFFRDAAAADALGRALTIDLASYLNRPVRCSLSQTTAPIADPWRFESEAAGFSWWIEFDAGLGSAFADAMIGGEGTAVFARGRRARGLVKCVASRMLRCIAAAAGVESPSEPSFVAATSGDAVALAGGSCAVASDQYGWQVGAVASEPVKSAETVSLAAISETRSISDTQPRHAPTPVEDPASIIATVVAALCAHLQRALRCEVSAQHPSVSDLADAELKELPPAALQLGLTAGGNGALVASLDRDAVAGLAAGVGAAAMPATEMPGDVVVAAAEAIVRDALREIAARLPGINGGMRRIVRLADNSLPARTPHHAVNVRLSICGRPGALYLLVPSWMLVPPGSGPVPSNEARP